MHFYIRESSSRTRHLSQATIMTPQVSKNQLDYHDTTLAMFDVDNAEHILKYIHQVSILRNLNPNSRGGRIPLDIFRGRGPNGIEA